MKERLREHIEQFKYLAETMEQYTYESLKSVCVDYMEVVRDDAAAHVITKAEATEVERQYKRLLHIKAFISLIA